MAEIRYYADEHIAKAVVRGIRQRKVDIVCVADIGLIGADDLAHLRFARKEARVIVTQDDDFLRFAANGEPHSGIVYAPQHTSIRVLVQGLILIQRVIDAEEMFDYVEFL